MTTNPDTTTTLAAELLSAVRHGVQLKYGVITDMDCDIVDITLRIARPLIVAEARAAERQRWAATFREMAAVALPNISGNSPAELHAGLTQLSKQDPNSPGQVQGRLLLELADLLDGDN